MRRIELLWDDGCPHVSEARANLAASLRAIGLDATWQEWRRDDPAAPPYAAAHGSPAILLDGRDIAPHEPSASACCRLYAGPNGHRAGAPSIESIVAALRTARSPDGLR
jgi:hypothetical protein